MGSSGSSTFNFSAKFQKLCKKKYKNIKDYAVSEYELRITATTATYSAESLDISRFSRVAVRKSTATTTATTATKIHKKEEVGS